MCLRPILIENPNFRNPGPFGTPVNPYSHFGKDVLNSYMEVPCGTCAECLSLKQNYLLQRCECMSLTHFIYFGTLTYKPGMLPYIEKMGKDGVYYKYYYSQIDDFRLMIKRMRRYGYLPRDTKYLAVTEYGGERHRPHWHFLLFIPKRSFLYAKEKPVQTVTKVKPGNCTELCTFDINAYWSPYNYGAFLHTKFLEEWKRNISNSTKKPVYESLCKYVVDAQGRSTYDFHKVESHTYDGKEVSDVCAYVTKYVLKFDPWIDKKRQAIHMNYHWDDEKEIWSLIRPRVLLSKYFGCCSDVHKEHVRKTVKLTLKTNQTDNRFVFIDVATGKTYPLSRYYINKYITPQEYYKYVKLQRLKSGQTDDTEPSRYLSESRRLREIERNNHDYIQKRECQQKKINALLLARIYSSDSFLLE